MTENLLKQFLDEHSYDIRQTGNGRWIDQKCAPDEVSFVSECVLEYVRETGNMFFQSPDVWKSDFAVAKVQQFFGKPDPLIRSTLDEYNKFFRQPLKMLAAAGVLKENGRVNNTIQFEVVNTDVLSFLARNDWNAYTFLYLYIEKTLRDSGIWDLFATFLDQQTKKNFDEMKDGFAAFCKSYTPIRTTVEANRIFAKVLNPLACRYHKAGTIAGRMSPVNITFNLLSYNRENWRDMNKPKDVARQDYGKSNPQPSTMYFAAKAMDEVKKFNKQFNDGHSEVLGKHSGGEATQMHHIFPRSEFSEIAAFVENIIALTPTQHFTLAHPSNNTSKVDAEFQYMCLLAKNETVRKNVMLSYGTTGFYSFDKLAFVLDVGFATDHFQNIPQNDFTSIRSGIDAQFE